jgi:hypothetical protein
LPGPDFFAEKGKKGISIRNFLLEMGLFALLKLAGLTVGMTNRFKLF